ncbi:MFS transporter [Ancylobacter sp. MQZ15Z-1]|uniref:MFS transporter n=1 Tax=Ancylobacter mangrovi TaxID=2972472 RepID=A0A9X2T606_9HYPH|nr:MFS transporter [Ancylobacter mangrovi]MCS0494438.1 MFS transporter [Ancylobacter mangrovi]
MPNARALTYLVASALFMENLDGTILVTALPAMARSFGVHPVDLGIGVSAYVLTLAMLIPLSGWLAERFGSRRIFTSAIMIFTAASILCGLSESLLTFTLARVLQGVGGAMMVPIGRLVVLRVTDKRDLIWAITTITWPGLVAPILGPPVGGLITMHFSWHWIFYLNVPLGIVAVMIALRLMPRGETVTPRPFDALGFVLTGVACFCLLYAVELVSNGRPAGMVLGLMVAIGLVTGFHAVAHARRHPFPLLDLSALTIRSYAVALRGGSLVRAAIQAVPFLLPLMFQVGFGLDPLESGMLVLAVFAGNLVMKLVTTAILRRFTFRSILLVNGTLNALAIGACALISAETPLIVTVLLMFVSGVTRSVQFTTLNTLSFVDVRPEQMSGANTLFNVLQQMALGMGVALAVLALRLAGLVDPAAEGVVPVTHFQMAFAMIGVVALIGTLDALRLDPKTGEAVRRRS